MAKSLGTQSYEQRLILPLGYVNFICHLFLVKKNKSIFIGNRYLRFLFWNSISEVLRHVQSSMYTSGTGSLV